MIMYDRRTLLDIGQRYTNLIKDTLSTDPAWPLEILRNNELNNDHPNNCRRRKKHRGRRAGISNRLRKRAHSPPLPSILLANVQSLENKMEDLRARITLRSKMPTKPTHCRLLANQIMPPFSSHRNTYKGSLMNRRWRGK